MTSHKRIDNILAGNNLIQKGTFMDPQTPQEEPSITPFTPPIEPSEPQDAPPVTPDPIPVSEPNMPATDEPSVAIPEQGADAEAISPSDPISGAL